MQPATQTRRKSCPYILMLLCGLSEWLELAETCPCLQASIKPTRIYFWCKTFNIYIYILLDDVVSDKPQTTINTRNCSSSTSLPAAILASPLKQKPAAGASWVFFLETRCLTWRSNGWPTTWQLKVRNGRLFDPLKKPRITTIFSRFVYRFLSDYRMISVWVI